MHDIDVFLSFSSRGTITPEWLTEFKDSLEKEYLSNYGQELVIWDYIEKNKTGDDFRRKIDNALGRTIILLLILDPSYFNSEDTQYEVAKYLERDKDDRYIIKTIKSQGAKAEDLKRLISPEIISAYFVPTGRTATDISFSKDSAEYTQKVKEMVSQIRTMRREYRLKETVKQILGQMTKMGEAKKLFVAFHDSGPNDHRYKFMNGLYGTIAVNEHPAVSTVRVLPDDLTEGDIQSEDLHDLFCNENEYREACLQKILAACDMVVVAMEHDTLEEARILYAKLQYQVRAIKKHIQQTGTPFMILLDLPKDMSFNVSFREDLMNPVFLARKNVQRHLGTNTTSFLELLIDQLEKRFLPPPPIPPASKERHVYIIRNEEKGGNDEKPAARQGQIECLLGCIPNQFVRLENNANYRAAAKENQANNGLLDAHFANRKWVSMSEAIIIYQGPKDDYDWCIDQQLNTFNIILELQNAHANVNPKRAVFLHPKNTERKPEEYTFYSYKVFQDCKELRDFL